MRTRGRRRGSIHLNGGGGKMVVTRCSLAGAITHLKRDCETALVSVGSFIPVTAVPLLAALCVTLSRHFSSLKGRKLTCLYPGSCVLGQVAVLLFTRTSTPSVSKRWPRPLKNIHGSNEHINLHEACDVICFRSFNQTTKPSHLDDLVFELWTEYIIQDCQI